MALFRPVKSRDAVQLKQDFPVGLKQSLGLALSGLSCGRSRRDSRPRRKTGTLFIYKLQLFNSAADKNSVFFTHKDQPCSICTDKKSGKIFLMYKEFKKNSEEIGCKVR
jgi:hypothetical protein